MAKKQVPIATRKRARFDGNGRDASGVKIGCAAVI